MFRRLRGDPDDLIHLRRVEDAVRVRYALAPSALVLVAQDRARVPGFPPHDTIVRFWIAEARYRLRIFKPVAAVRDADLPPAFLLPGLIDDGDPDCC